MFYTYRQNNSGGVFDFSDTIGQYVIVEAESPYNANKRAESIGLYFNGVEEELDCECCGDRWYEADEGTEEPMTYGKSVNFEFAGEANGFVHYLNGTVKPFRSNH
jgi:hypothetical protein